MRTQRYVQPESFCAEKETWVFVKAEVEEREEDINAEDQEGKVESEPLDEDQDMVWVSG